MIIKREMHVARDPIAIEHLISGELALPQAPHGYDGRYWPRYEPETQRSYSAILASLRVVETQTIDDRLYLKLGFSLMFSDTTPPDMPPVIWAWCLPEFRQGSTLWAWVDALMYQGRGIPDHLEELDTETMVDHRAQIQMRSNGSLELWPMIIVDLEESRMPLDRRLAESPVLRPYAELVPYLLEAEDNPLAGIADSGLAFYSDLQILEWIHKKVAFDLFRAERAWMSPSTL
jgi:hypothetical protein